MKFSTVFNFFKVTIFVYQGHYLLNDLILTVFFVKKVFPVGCRMSLCSQNADGKDGLNLRIIQFQMQ